MTSMSTYGSKWYLIPSVMLRDFCLLHIYVYASRRICSSIKTDAQSRLRRFASSVLNLFEHCLLTPLMGPKNRKGELMELIVHMCLCAQAHDELNTNHNLKHRDSSDHKKRVLHTCCLRSCFI